VVPVGEPSDAPKGPLVAAAEPDRDIAALGGQGTEDEVIELVEPAMEPGRVARPQVPAQVDGLLGVRAAVGEPIRNADIRKLGRAPANPEAGDQPPAR
jgi:hypothetical protein